MINHIRTILLNMPSSGAASASGEVLVSSGFSAIKLYGAAAELQRSLIPSGASRDTANYRINGLMVLLHSPDFEPYLLRFDPRITYRISDFAYASEATPASGYPPFNLARLADNFSATLGKTGYNLFDFSEYQTEMQVFRNVWFGNLSLKDRFTAGVMALAYSMERIRQHGA